MLNRAEGASMKRMSVIEILELVIQVTCIGVGFVAVFYWLASVVLSLGTGRGEYFQQARHEAYMKLQAHTGHIRNAADAMEQARILQLQKRSPDPRWR